MVFSLCPVSLHLSGRNVECWCFPLSPVERKRPEMRSLAIDRSKGKPRKVLAVFERGERARYEKCSRVEIRRGLITVQRKNARGGAVIRRGNRQLSPPVKPREYRIFKSRRVTRALRSSRLHVRLKYTSRGILPSISTAYPVSTRR